MTVVFPFVIGYTDIKDTKQLLSSKEDWEVDPLQVQLGLELGQGAFGRVLTGVYDGKKVAIKILKGNILHHINIKQFVL